MVDARVLTHDITYPLYVTEKNRGKNQKGRPVEGKILAWGNSYGVRITKQELQDAGLKPGQRVRLWIEDEAGQPKIPPSVKFRDPGFDATAEHDEYLAGKRSEELRRRRR